MGTKEVCVYAKIYGLASDPQTGKKGYAGVSATFEVSDTITDEEIEVCKKEIAPSIFLGLAKNVESNIVLITKEEFERDYDD